MPALPLLWAAIPACAAAPFLVSPDRPDGVYPAPAEVTFSVSPAPGDAAVRVVRDRAIDASGVESSVADGLATVRASLAAPGWYRCEVRPTGADKPVAAAGVVVGPESFGPAAPAPADLAAFWAAKKEALAAAPAEALSRPLTAEQLANDNAARVEELRRAGFEVADVEIPTLDGVAPARGYFARPVEASPKSRPAILMLHAAGVSGPWCKASAAGAMAKAQRYGALVFDLNAHGMKNGQPPEYYTGLEAAELKGYPMKGAENRDQFYFVGMYLRLLRAIDFLCAQPEWDGRVLVAMGESQGGGQALAAAALDARVSGVFAVVPAMCDWAAPLAGRTAGWPAPLGRNGSEDEQRRRLAVVGYCDNVNLAPWSRADTMILVGLLDPTCPPPGIFATFNQLPGPKRLVAYPRREHSGFNDADAPLGRPGELEAEWLRGHLAQHPQP